MDTFVGVALLVSAAAIAARTAQVAVAGRERIRAPRSSNSRRAPFLRPTHRYPRR